MKALLPHNPDIVYGVDPAVISTELTGATKDYFEMVEYTQWLFENFYSGINIMKEDPEMEGMTIDQMFVYLKAKMK